MRLVRDLRGNWKWQKARIQTRIGEYLQNTNWNLKTSKDLACMFEKREEILSFPKFW
ncbi:hypothetical protein ACO1KB_02895 [Leptospira interrogans serovar Szwajizak]|uniref:hypothetical protein n=1 Tax=Leptospira interrogans TaxID=173 RepID=UPI000344D345|nr:hypothetical protein [Leptospira interrogans]